MITVKMNQTKLIRDLNNIVEYSFGFVDGINRGKKVFLNNLGLTIKNILEQFIDSNARSNPQMLHHVYEWYRIGSPEARLFNIHYTVSPVGVSTYFSFKQSQSIKQGSNVPFYNKARIIESGTPVIIKPVRAQALSFEQDGETVFTKNPVEVLNPGGTRAQNGFEKTINLFFTKYFTQAFLKTSGVSDYLSNPIVYKNNLRKGKNMGRSVGVSTGYSWIANAGVNR